MYVVNVVQDDVPSEMTIGPWIEYEECAEWLSLHFNPRWKRIQSIEVIEPWE
jgi:hypothetical protein